ncbi:MAG: hypothetical protein IKJ70_00330 [Clostridia bacterium]|nr:hypothetical protein [Clostridia bacterium]
MKKLLSVFLAIIMIFSCCTIAVNALYLETVTEVSYLNNAKESEISKEDDPIATSGIYDALGITNSVSLQSLDGPEFIEAITKVNPTDGEYVQVLGEDGVPLVDMFGEPIYSKTSHKKQLTVLGMPLASIFGQREPFLWDNLTAHPDDFPKGDPNEIITDISKSDINLLVANTNMLMLRMLKRIYSGYRFYTDKNAVSLINTIGKVLDPNFATVSGNVFTNKEYDRIVTIENSAGAQYDTGSADETIFFERVSDLSGLSSCIQANWIDYGATRSNFKTLIKLFGVTEGVLLERDYMSGTKVGAAILSCAYSRIMGEGPINYFLSVFKPLTKTYNTTYITPIKLLFSLKKNVITDEEFATIPGLLNLIFNDGNEDKGYQFAPMPVDRLATADADSSEFNLILLIYLNVNTLYKNNKIETDKFISKLTEFAKEYDCVSLARELKNVIVRITGNIDYAFFEFADLTIDTIEGKPGEFFGNFKDSVAKMITRIVDWFRMWFDIFLGNRDFGQNYT